jgi:hypothetical protein
MLRSASVFFQGPACACMVQGLDLGLSLGLPQPSLKHELKLDLRTSNPAPMPAGEGLSSGHSGSGHLDIPDTKPGEGGAGSSSLLPLAVNRRLLSGSPCARLLPPCPGAAAGASSPAVAGQQGRGRRRTYELRTRSSSLRAAWVEADAEDEAGPTADASTDSEGGWRMGSQLGSRQAHAVRPCKPCLRQQAGRSMAGRLPYIA